MTSRNSIGSVISLPLLFFFAAEAIRVPHNYNNIAPSPTANTTRGPAPSPALKPAPVAAITRNINPELARLCGFTQNPSFCAEVTAPFLKGESDAVSVLKAAMEAAKESTFLAIKEGKKFSLEDTSSVAKSCLDICIENYESALGDFETSFTAIEERDVASLNANLDATLTMVSTCKDTVAESPGVLSPMEDVENRLLVLINNCLAIRNAIKDTSFL